MRAIFVFIQKGCGACHEYLPRFQSRAARYAHTVPIGIYDLARGGHPEAFAHKLGIRATPTTIVLTPTGKLQRYEGALPDGQITQLLQSAVR